MSCFEALCGPDALEQGVSDIAQVAVTCQPNHDWLPGQEYPSMLLEVLLRLRNKSLMSFLRLP